MSDHLLVPSLVDKIELKTFDGEHYVSVVDLINAFAAQEVDARIQKLGVEFNDAIAIASSTDEEW